MLRIIQVVSFMVLVMSSHGSCEKNSNPKPKKCERVCKPQVECPRDVPGSLVEFYDFGSYVGLNDEGTKQQRKQYYLAKAEPIPNALARSLCQAANLEVVYLETLDEFNKFFEFVKASTLFPARGSSLINIDGIHVGTPLTLTEWYSIKTQKLFNYTLPFGERGSLNRNSDRPALCLCLSKFFENLNLFNLPCNANMYVVCQKTDPCHVPAV